jgi:3-oxo-4,17-pregnadiene-20-carboxyl-CoA hydratase beta subunit
MNAAVGTELPELVIDVTPTFVIAAAIATRDYQDVHHDRDLAVARGGKDIFINILTTTGLVQRYVTDWAGADALVRQVDIRLGAPCYAGDTLTFSGRVVRAGGLECAVEVTGRCGLGDHVTGTVRVSLPESGGGREARGRGKQSGGGREARGRGKQSGGGREARGRGKQSGGGREARGRGKQSAP